MLTKAKIAEMLNTDKRAVARALVVLNERQTDDEQRSENTRYLNGMGFRPCHARMGTSMAKFFLRTGFLTDKQVAYWRVKERTGKTRIEIYAGQLLEVAELKAAAKATQPALAVPAAAQALADEKYMQEMDAEADRRQTDADELDKFIARCAMEGGIK